MIIRDMVASLLRTLIKEEIRLYEVERFSRGGNQLLSPNVVDKGTTKINKDDEDDEDQEEQEIECDTSEMSGVGAVAGVILPVGMSPSVPTQRTKK